VGVFHMRVDDLSVPVNKVEERQSRIIKSLVLLVILLVVSLAGVVADGFNATDPTLLPPCATKDGNGHDSVVLVP